MRFLAELFRLVGIIAVAAGTGFGVLVAMDRMKLFGKGPEILIGFVVAAGVGIAMLRIIKSRPAITPPPKS